MLHQKLMNDLEKQSKQNDVLMEQWAIEQENKRLQKDIEDRNQLFKTKIKRKIDAAVRIQRAFRIWNRFRKFGLKTWELEQNEQLFEDYQLNNIESPQKALTNNL
jgi:hypothetical protein